MFVMTYLSHTNKKHCDIRAGTLKVLEPEHSTKRRPARVRSSPDLLTGDARTTVEYTIRPYPVHLRSHLDYGKNASDDPGVILPNREE